MANFTKMKLWLLTMLLLVGSVVWGQLLISEDFSGFNTNNLAGQGGWLKGGTGPDATVASTQPLIYENYNGGGGEYVVMPSATSTASRVYKSFTNTTAIGNTFYISFLLRLTSTTVTGDYFISLGDPTTGTTYAPRLFAKSSGAGYVLGASKVATVGSATFGTTVLSYNTTYLIIVRFTGVSGNANDLTYVWVNPPLSSEPNVNSAEITVPTGDTDPGYSGGNIGNFHWHNRSVNNPTGAFDGVRVARATTSSSAWVNLAALSTSISTPTTQASNITFSSIGQTNMTANWTNGNGSKRVVLINTSNTFTAPADGTDPTASTVYNGAGQQVVYNGSGNSVSITGLSASTTYWYRVYEYNGSGTGTKYLTDAGTNNPNSQTTNAPTPTITLTPATLTGFNYVHGAGPSAEQSFTLSGANLTHDISLTAPSNYEISKTSSTGFAASLDFAQTGGDVSSQTVYVRLKANLSIGNYDSEIITASSTGADNKTVTVSGSVSAPPSPEPSAHVTGFDAVENGQNAIILSWTDAAGADGYLIKASTTSFEAIAAAPVDGTPESDGILAKNVVQGEGTVEFTGLAAGTIYYFKIWPYSNSGASIDYKTDGSVPQVSATTEAAPPTINFDEANNWAQGSAALGSYANNHTYTENSWLFTGGDALRNGTPTQDGFVGALGTYSWRLRDATTVTWTATYTANLLSNQNITSFGFDARRWDGSPSPAYTVEYSTDGGTSWTAATSIGDNGVLNNTGFDNSSNWKTFTQNINSPYGMNANSFIVRLSATSGERIMIDNFTYKIESGPIFSGEGNWSDLLNWNKQPGSTDNVVIIGEVNIDENANVANITLAPQAKLTVNSGQTLTVSGNLTLESNAAGTATLVDNGAINVTGTITAQQYLAASRNWYVASPVSNANALGAGFEYWQYNEPNGSSTTENWTVLSANTPLVPGRGYVVKPSAETTYAFSTTTGTLNTGVVTVPLTRTVGVTKEGFNLVGNPYPSYLNLNDLLTGDLETSYWMRSRNAGNTAWIFDSFNKDGNVAVNNSGKTVTTYVPPMQSFWVRVKTGVASTNLVFDNTMRAHIDEPTNRFRAPQNSPLIRLEMSNGTASDQTVLYAHADASDAFDRFDTHKMLNNSAAVPDIYSMLGSQKMVINGMQSLPLNIEMPLGILVKEAGSFSIRASEVRAIDADIVLIDKLNGNAEWLLNGGAEYQFASSTTTHAERFALVLRAPGTTTGECCNDILGAQTMVFVDAFKNINISCAMPVNKNAKVAVYNAVGQMLTQQNLENGVARIAVANHGVYLVELNVDGLKTTKRVIVK